MYDSMETTNILVEFKAFKVDQQLLLFPVFALALFVTYALAYIFYNVFFHPLAGVPGPRLAASTRLWLLWKTFTLEKCEALHNGLAKYGPIVRIAPNKVLVNSQEDIKTIYPIGSKFLKSDFYPAWGLKGSSNIISTIGVKDHAVRRSITAKTFAMNSVLQFLPAIMEHVHGMVRFLDEHCSGKTAESETVEFVKLYRYMALDILGSATLGEDFALVKSGKEHPFVSDLDSCVATIPVRGNVPTWLWWLLEQVPVRQWQIHLGGEKRLSDYAATTIAKVNAGPKQELPTLISSYSSYQAPDGARLPEKRIIGEIAAVYFAGTDTTSNTLAFATFELAGRPDIQALLHAELVGRMPDKGSFPSYEELESFEYLNAVIFESLRVYAAIPSHLERVAPAGGTTLQGYMIPAGTVVGVQAYSLHRDPRVFPNPERFEPERWLKATTEMKKFLQPWGFGSRKCMGMHLAYLEFRYCWRPWCAISPSHCRLGLTSQVWR